MFKTNLPSEPQQFETLLEMAEISAEIFLPFSIYRLRSYVINGVVSRKVEIHSDYDVKSYTETLKQLLTLPYLHDEMLANTSKNWRPDDLNGCVLQSNGRWLNLCKGK